MNRLWLRFKYRKVKYIDEAIRDIFQKDCYEGLTRHGLFCWNGDSQRYQDLKEVKKLRNKRGV